MHTYLMEWDRSELSKVISIGFDYFEKKDEIVGFICMNPHILKPLVLVSPDEFEFDYIPDGIGRVRTAYLKYRVMNDNEVRFLNQDKSMLLRIILV